MAVAHTTLLQFLGKHIQYQLAVDTSFDVSGFVNESGKVTGVLLELDGDHQLCVKVDGYDNHEFIKFSDIKLLS